MNNSPNRVDNWLTSSNNDQNLLWQYLRSLDAPTMERLSQPSSEAVAIMENQLMGILGNLPREHFNATITTSREALGQLLASAMMNGYFLRSAEQRLEMEKLLEHSISK